MKNVLIAAALALFAASAHADHGSCAEHAKDKKLSGAAKNSFMKKCERDASSACKLSADEKKLNGAARNSHVKKCTREAVNG
ncbi:MAG: hypothetical protein NTV17_19230 [Burkholderiales bacterium]|jgi:hypothetical protein|nr:hypothetical protein [Burkholderiales bacterium]